jgi:hypothetical protein
VGYVAGLALHQFSMSNLPYLLIGLSFNYRPSSVVTWLCLFSLRWLSQSPKMLSSSVTIYLWSCPGYWEKMVLSLLSWEKFSLKRVLIFFFIFPIYGWGSFKNACLRQNSTYLSLNRRSSKSYINTYCTLLSCMAATICPRSALEASLCEVIFISTSHGSKDLV